jgi:Family of unknown function (DUF6069)
VSTKESNAMATTTTSTRPLLRSTVFVGAAAAALATALAAAAREAGVSFEVDGEGIPLASFAQLTFLGAVIGGLALSVLNRRSAAPRRRFFQTTVALTAASCLPSLTLPDDLDTRLALVAMHLLVAATVVSVLVRHARR